MEVRWSTGYDCSTKHKETLEKKKQENNILDATIGCIPLRISTLEYYFIQINAQFPAQRISLQTI